MTIRMILGRGWGQGPTHSQNLQAMFAHVPGLKVVMPSSAADAKGLLLSAIFDPNPVIFLEHRWLHNLKGEVPAGDYRLPLGRCNLLSEGGDATIVSSSLMLSLLKSPSGPHGSRPNRLGREPSAFAKPLAARREPS